MKKLTVIGVGNRLRGDDAAGPLVIDRLMELDHPRIEAIDAGSDAIGILEYLEDRPWVWIIDACQMGKEPGELLHFTPADVGMVTDLEPQSLHGLGLSEALQMADQLGMMPEDIQILGVQPESVEFQTGLSASVKTALEGIIESIHAAVQDFEEKPLN